MEKNKCLITAGAAFGVVLLSILGVTLYGSHFIWFASQYFNVVLMLTLLCLSFVLLFFVMLMGYNTLVKPFRKSKSEDACCWLESFKVDAVGTKIAVLLMWIASVTSLSGFLNIRHDRAQDLFWLLMIQIVFSVSAFGFVLVDRLGKKKD